VAPPQAAVESRAASAAELGHHIKGLIGITARITVTEPGGVERSQGKARRVIDKRPKS
jgi:phenylacetate-CoA ligase